MMKKISFVLLLLCLGFTATAYGINMRYLKYSPVSQFTEKDFEIMKETGLKVLNESKEGETSQWQNPQTGHSGSIQLIKNMNTKERTCKKLQIINQTAERYGKSVFVFCLQEDGKWKADSSNKALK